MGPRHCIVELALSDQVCCRLVTALYYFHFSLSLSVVFLSYLSLYLLLAQQSVYLFIICNCIHLMEQAPYFDNEEVLFDFDPYEPASSPSYQGPFSLFSLASIPSLNPHLQSRRRPVYS